MPRKIPNKTGRGLWSEEDKKKICVSTMVGIYKDNRSNHEKDIMRYTRIRKWELGYLLIYE